MPVIQLPLISRIQAGNRQKIPQGQAAEYDAVLLACPIRCSTDSFMLRVRGAGMEPRFNEYDLLYVDSNHGTGPQVISGGTAHGLQRIAEVNEVI